jgi:hypothetical protein
MEGYNYHEELNSSKFKFCVRAERLDIALTLVTLMAFLVKISTGTFLKHLEEIDSFPFLKVRYLYAHGVLVMPSRYVCDDSRNAIPIRCHSPLDRYAKSRLTALQLHRGVFIQSYRLAQKLIIQIMDTNWLKKPLFFLLRRWWPVSRSHFF